MITLYNDQQSAGYGSLLRRYLAPEWRRASSLLVLMLLDAGLALANPALLARFIDAVLGGEKQVLALGGLFLLVACIGQLVTVATNVVGTDLGLRTANRLRTDLTFHCLNLDLAFHNRTTPGTLIERIDGDVSRLNEFLSAFAPLLVRNGLILGGALVAITFIDWRVGLVLLAFVVLLLAFLEYARRVALPTIKRERAESAELMSVIEERLAGVEDLQANGATAYVLRRFAEQSRRWGWAHVRAHTVGALPNNGANVLYAAGVALTLGIAVWLVGGGTITIGAAYAIYRYLELLRWPLQNIGRQVQQLQQAGAAIIRIQELFAQRSLIADSGTLPITGHACSVGFAGVTFAYPPSEQQPTEPNRNALEDLSFELPAGKTLGLLGRTGSGKTTITRLLLRFYTPSSGVVMLNGVALEAIALDALRTRIGLVTQDVQLFNATVRENLSLFDSSISDERLHAALAAVEMADWLATQPNGLDTVLPSGGGVSAGQAQLLAVARVLLRDPALIILDEASSRLDPATEQRLEHAFARLLAGRTAIIIAHRLATVQRADAILILEDGCILEHGERTALAASPNSHFAQLLLVGMEAALA